MLRPFSHFYNAPNPSNQSFDNTISYHKLSYIKILLHCRRCFHTFPNQYVSGKSAFACADPEGTRGPDSPPLKNYKNIGFLSNSGPDPLKNYEATKPAFNVGPSSAR